MPNCWTWQQKRVLESLSVLKTKVVYRDFAHWELADVSHFFLYRLSITYFCNGFRSLNFIHWVGYSLSDIWIDQQLIPSGEVTTRKPSSDFDWLIVQTFALLWIVKRNFSKTVVWYLRFARARLFNFNAYWGQLSRDCLQVGDIGERRRKRLIHPRFSSAVARYIVIAQGWLLAAKVLQYQPKETSRQN